MPKPTGAKREFILAHPHDSPESVVAAAKEQGLELSKSYVFEVRKPRAKKPAAAPIASTSNAATLDVSALTALENVEREFLRIVIRMGIERAKSTLEAIENVMGKVFA